MQAWGDASRFTQRLTDTAPTKSGVVGLLAAARGLRRTDPLEELLAIRFGVRIDQPGRIERDLQTARTADGKHAFPLTDRYYLTDAAFVAAVNGPPELIAALEYAVQHPVFPLYLGRRSCVPQEPLCLGVRQAPIWPALADEPWHAARWWRIRQAKTVDLEVRIDREAAPAAIHTDWRTSVKDAPVSFDPRLRQWRAREVVRGQVTVNNPDGSQAMAPIHDPIAVLGGG